MKIYAIMFVFENGQLYYSFYQEKFERDVCFDLVFERRKDDVLIKKVNFEGVYVEEE